MRYHDKVAKANDNNNNNNDLLGRPRIGPKARERSHSLLLSPLSLSLFLCRIWGNTMVTGARGAS